MWRDERSFSQWAGEYRGYSLICLQQFKERQTLNNSWAEKQGKGYVVASIGEASGEIPYTAYFAKKSYIENNTDEVEKFTRAIQKGLDYVYTHSDEEVAKAITSYFPDTSMNDLIKIVKRYRENDSWFKTTEITEQDYKHIEEIIESAGELTEKAPYDKLVTTEFSKHE